MRSTSPPRRAGQRASLSRHGRAHPAHSARRKLATFALLAALLGCSAAEPAATQVVVTLGGDAEVLRQISRLEVRVYPAERADPEQPFARHTFRLPAAEPLTLGIARGASERFLLAVLGFGSDDPSELPLIERKVLARFAPDETLQLDVLLEASCLRLSHPCTALDRTCLGTARACVPTAEAALQPVSPGREVAPAPPAQAPPSGACSGDHACRSPDYPCVATQGGGYTCLGQLADWPMPDATPGSAHAPSYDLGTLGVVRDLVTGLTWERHPAQPYEGCTGVDLTKPVPGSTCTWDEAKVYCSKLRLADLTWRLPSKVEVESILDPTSFPVTLDHEVFPGCDGSFWTSSALPRWAGTLEPQMYVVMTGNGSVAFQSPRLSACVRCVSGVPSGPGTPTSRYVVEPGALVRDVRTGLTWQQQPGDPAATVDEAIARCAALGGGFRLPSAKELLTTIDPERRTPAMDPVFALASAGDYYWTMPGAGATRLVQPLLGVLLPTTLVEAAERADSVPPRVRCVR